MIILQTGVPGSGKTASAVDLLLNDESYTHYTDKDGVKQKRLLFVNGIDEFKIEHTPLTDEQIKEQPFQDFLPYGALVVIDEAQRIFPTRAPSQKVPEFVEALATHRHHGLDIIIITQHPTFLDTFVRKLVQRHIHVRILPIGRKLYEWNQCQDNPDSEAALSKGIARNFTVPEETFDLYKSAEIHTKPKRRLPKALIFFIIFAPLLAVYILYTFFDMKQRFTGRAEETTGVQISQPTASTNPSGGQQNNYGGYVGGHQPEQNLMAEMFVPTIPERPESKPLYNGVRQVNVFERVAGCVKSSNSCTCYSDQATEIVEISLEICQRYVEKGLPFNPYKQQQAQMPTESQPAETIGQP